MLERQLKLDFISDTQERETILKAYQGLLDGYLASNHRKKVDIIANAFEMACRGHNGTHLSNGDPYILHPIAVACIVNQEIGLGSTSICAALLHDVVEKTDCTIEDIESQCSPKIASIVSGLTKISGGVLGEKSSEQAENLRKLILSMSEDIRIILVKMADRLEDMRTISSSSEQMQKKIVAETNYIYAPLADRLGLNAIKTELEDLCFKYEHPEDYETLRSKIIAGEGQRKKLFAKVVTPIRKDLEVMGIKCTMTARVKTPYSVWRKMQRKQIPFSDVYDLYAGRIVFEGKDEADEKDICWKIYYAISSHFYIHPERTRDWVTTPKPNGYQALQLTLMGPDGQWVEVQIRSKRMDDIAEQGVAAHWRYKSNDKDEEPELNKWINTIQDILKNPDPDSLDFLDTIKLNLFSSEIVVFTPKGDLITLQKDATVLDFAFAIHSKLGVSCIAGKVNHKLVPISYKLHSGDQIEILTSSTQHPTEVWLSYVNTAKGKAQLRTALSHSRSNVRQRGERIYHQFLADYKIEECNEVLTKTITILKQQNRDSLYLAIGNDEIALTETLADKIRSKRHALSLPKLSKWLKNPFHKSEEDALSEQTSQEYVLNSGEGAKDEGKSIVTLFFEGIDYVGTLDWIVTTITAKYHCNVRNMNYSGNNGVFRCSVDVAVETPTVISQICTAIRQRKGLYTATRIG